MDLPRRTDRHPIGHRRTMPRDLLALRLVAEAQPVTATQVRALLGMSDDVAARRLAVLRDLGLVTVHVTAPHEPNRYLLAKGALPVLERAFTMDREGLRTPKGLGRTNLAHHDGVVDLYVALMVACATSGRATMGRFRWERELREAAGPGAGVLVPDAAAVLDDGQAEPLGLVIEVDLGSENPSWFATKKCTPYAELWRARHRVADTRRWVVVVVVPTLRRLHRLALAAWDADVPEGMLYFAVASQLTGKSALTEVWVTPRVENGVAILKSAALPLTVGTNRRNGSDGLMDELSASEATVSSQSSHALWHGVGR